MHNIKNMSRGVIIDTLSEEPTIKMSFSGRLVSIVKDTLSFVVGFVFFPFSLIMAGISEYKHCKGCSCSTRLTVFRAIKASISTIPVLGGIVHASVQAIRHFSPKLHFVDHKSGIGENILTCIPFVGSGSIAVMLNHCS